MSTSISSTPIHLAAVSIANLRGFSTFDTKLSVPVARNEGQWILLIGENGAGKSTVLRALALALAEPSVASQLIAKRRNGPFRRNGHPATISVWLNDDSRFDVSVDENGELETVTDKHSKGDRPWVVGYGVRRGSSGLPDDDAIDRLHTLFDHPPAMYDAHQWLLNLDAEAAREFRELSSRENKTGSSVVDGPQTRLWNTVKTELCTLLELKQDGLRVSTAKGEKTSELYVDHKRFGWGRFSALSDAYLTLASWVVDLIGRWIDFQHKADREISPNFTKRMTGIVLIDELDLHLHPLWQLEIVPQLRAMFPRMTFVATTHNPLVLQGARSGEVYVLRRNETEIEMVQQDVREGSTVLQVLFDQFGVLYTYDAATRKKLEEYREALEKPPASRDNARIDELRQELTTTIGTAAVRADSAIQHRVNPRTPLGNKEESARIAAKLRGL